MVPLLESKHAEILGYDSTHLFNRNRISEWETSEGNFCVPEQKRLEKDSYHACLISCGSSTVQLKMYNKI